MTARNGIRLRGLGFAALRPQWRRLLRREHLMADLSAGTTVALMAVPLSMAVAIASDLPIAYGLVTSIVAGIVGALMGGSPLSVCGPTAAMAVLVASIVEEHGLAGLVLASLFAAAMQLTAGLLGLGRIARLVPLPVVLGFTASIGVLIFVGQLPRALGLPAPDQAHVVDVITHIGELLEHSNLAAVAIAGFTFALVLLASRRWPRLPGPLFAVVFTTVAAVGLGLQVERVGAIPRTLFSLPMLSPGGIDVASLLGDAVVIFGLSTLETLLSASALDRMSRATPHDPDQEIVGQGLANLAAVATGGMMGAGVIARSSLNFTSGGRTRRSAIVHSLVVLLIVVALAPWVEMVPMPTLAGILLAIAVRMIAVREMHSLFRISRAEGLVCLLTFAAMVAFDLVAGIRIGVAVSLAIAAVRFGRTDARVVSVGGDGPYRITLEGALSFLGLHSLDELRAGVPRLDAARGVIVDLTGVTAIDISGGDALAQMLNEIRARGIALAILYEGPLPETLMTHDHYGHFAAHTVATEDEAQRMLGREGITDPAERLTGGVERFRKVARARHRELFKRLASGQAPHTMFIACSDSRISPLLMTSAEPGEVFVHRNVGNIVPPTGTDGMPAEGAGVEYAVGVLKVKQIVVCGHSGCGAMAAIRDGIPPGLPSAARWLGHASHVQLRVPAHASGDALARANVLLQLENLRSYDIVREAVERGELTLHGWYYDIDGPEIEAWDAERGAFVPIRPSAGPSDNLTAIAG